MLPFVDTPFVEAGYRSARWTDHCVYLNLHHGDTGWETVLLLIVYVFKRTTRPLRAHTAACAIATLSPPDQSRKSTGSSKARLFLDLIGWQAGVTLMSV